MIKKIDLASKIVKLWAITMLHYRTKTGDMAWDAISRLTNKDTSSVIAFISGFSMAIDINEVGLEERLKSLINIKDDLEV